MEISRDEHTVQGGKIAGEDDPEARVFIDGVHRTDLRATFNGERATGDVKIRSNGARFPWGCTVTITGEHDTEEADDE